MRTSADLTSLVNETALLATRRHADVVTPADFTKAIDRIVAGQETTQLHPQPA